MERYISVVERQTHLFRQGYRLAGRDLDAHILRLKMRQQAAIDALLAHQADHYANAMASEEEIELDVHPPQRRFA